jgi:hypothetical protein
MFCRILSYILISISFLCFSCKEETEIKLRTFPYPYKAAFTIADDIDRQSFQDFKYIQNFFNRHDIEIGGSFWMYHDSKNFPVPEIEFSYFEGISQQRSDFADEMKDYIRCGILESLHTFAQTQPIEDSNIGREEYRYAINELKNNIGVGLKHWINHGDSPDKIGPDPVNRGDNSDTRFYHTDFTNADKSNGNYTFEFYHTWDGSYNEPNYQLPQYVLFLDTLDDGSKVYKYSRYHGVEDPPRSDELHLQISDENLQTLVDSGGVCILYMHLGTVDEGKVREDGYDHGIDDIYPPLDENGERQLKKLSEFKRKGDIYVTTSTKLFQYLLSYQRLTYSVHGDEIRIQSIDDQVRGSYIPTIVDLQGITFYTPNPEKTRVFIRDEEVTHRLTINPDDGQGQSISFPLLHITRPEDNPLIIRGVLNTIYSGDGNYKSISYNIPITDRLNVPQVQILVDLTFNSGEVSIFSDSTLADYLSFYTKGTAKEIDITIIDDEHGFNLSENAPYELKSGNEIIDTQVAKEGKINFTSLIVGKFYEVTPVKI